MNNVSSWCNPLIGAEENMTKKENKGAKLS